MVPLAQQVAPLTVWQIWVGAQQVVPAQVWPEAQQVAPHTVVPSGTQEPPHSVVPPGHRHPVQALLGTEPGVPVQLTQVSTPAAVVQVDSGAGQAQVQVPPLRTAPLAQAGTHCSTPLPVQETWPGAQAQMCRPLNPL